MKIGIRKAAAFAAVDPADFWPRFERQTAIFSPHVDTPCWVWTGAQTSTGYGYLVRRIGGKQTSVSAHRAAYALHAGTDLPEMFVCHRCDNPLCGNPDHLFLGTARDNVRDMMRKGRQSMTGQYLKQNPRRGADQSRAKLTAADVVSLRQQRDAGVLLKDLAKQYGISKSIASRIARRVDWKHV